MPISSFFKGKKSTIIRSLSTDPKVYSDKSPKGSVDEGIRELIDEVNAHEGLVTTSSCAGRISVFLEGGGGGGGQDGEDDCDEEGVLGEKITRTRRRRVPGGKGQGRFLFVSHVSLGCDDDDDGGDGENEMERCLAAAGFAGEVEGEISTKGGSGSQRSLQMEMTAAKGLVRFAFEPMILHVMAASLHHAKPLLSAAISSGFRESGVQSLKILDDPGACPMVAVRSAGLRLEAIIGIVAAGTAAAAGGGGEEDGNDGSGNIRPQMRYIVNREYRNLLLKLASGRFMANGERIERFRQCLVHASMKPRHWESDEARRTRKREDGLRRRNALRSAEAIGEAKSKDMLMTEDDHDFYQL